MSTRITVVGIGAEGPSGLTSAARAAIDAADVVLGGSRHLEWLAPSPTQQRITWPSPLRENLPALLDEHAGSTVVALASGDPLVSGIATTLIEVLGAEAVEVLPALSSVALARARMRWSEESTTVVTLVGRDPHLIARSLAPGMRLIVLSSDRTTPGQVARLLAEAGYGSSELTVLGRLGADDESVSVGLAASWSDDDVPDLNVVAVHVVSSGARLLGFTAGLPDDAFEHDGQLTKRDVRASALAHLAPVPGQLLWDVGAGAGSIGVEWMRAHPTCRSIAIEERDERAERIARNAERLGVPGLEVVVGHAPAVLSDLPTPDAIFIGGGVTEPGLIDLCWDALAAGGRLVVHGVTLETENLLARRYAEHGGDLTRLHVEHAAPIGTFTGWTPARAITQWSVTR